MRKILLRGFIVLSAFSLLILPAAGAWAQVISIDTRVEHYVHGNGELPHGRSPNEDDKWTISPSDNKVEIKTGGSVANENYEVDVFGGYSDYGVVNDTGNEDDIDAKNNCVTVSGTVEGNVYGGCTIADGGSAIGNTVVIYGTVTGNVYGGSSDDGDAINNTVRITGSPDVKGILYGGEAEEGISEGNALWLESAVTVAGLGDFQKLSFTLPRGTKNGDVILKVIELPSRDITESYYGMANIDGAAVEISGDFSSLGIGDKTTLIDAVRLEGEPANTSVRSGGIEFRISKEGNKLVATVASEPEPGNPDSSGGCDAGGTFAGLLITILFVLDRMFYAARGKKILK